MNDIYQQKLTTHRRELHKIPELRRQLPKTKEYLLSVLETLDCEITFPCESGICAYFDRGQEDTYGFRADMDGLPIQEVNECDYKSTHDGQMHACGHDAHMSMVLTFGEYIDEIKDLKHNVLLIFQPAEESDGGAEVICQSGVLDKYNVTRVYGIHMWPFMEAGKISSRPGAFMPKSCEFHAYINGKSVHGTAPYEGLDALYIATDYVKRVYMKHAEIPGAIPRFAEGIGDIPRAETTEPEKRTLIHFGKFESGHARNIVSNHTHMMGTVRAYCEEDFQMIINLLKETLNEMKADYGCGIHFTNTDGYPPVYNDPELYAKIRESLFQLPSGYEEMAIPLVISEDFSFFGIYRPAVFFVLGTGTGIALHSTNFDFDEKVLLSGLQLYISLING